MKQILTFLLLASFALAQDGTTTPPGIRTLNGTANQVEVTGTGTSRTVKLPNAVVAPGTLQVTGATTFNGATVFNSTTGLPGSIGITIDGGGSAITTGVKGYVQVPFACTITSVTMLADVSGSAVVDIWKDTYANYPPTIADTITASAKPTLSSAIKSTDSTLASWNKSVAAGTVIGWNVDSATTITRLTVILNVTK